jgi:hypothetical protein
MGPGGDSKFTNVLIQLVCFGFSGRYRVSQIQGLTVHRAISKPREIGSHRTTKYNDKKKQFLLHICSCSTEHNPRKINTAHEIENRHLFPGFHLFNLEVQQHRTIGPDQDDDNDTVLFKVGGRWSVVGSRSVEVGNV